MVDHMIDMFLSSSLVHHLEACVLREHYFLIHFVKPWVFIENLNPYTIAIYSPWISGYRIQNVSQINTQFIHHIT
jgi:hypothetical protein